MIILGKGGVKGQELNQQTHNFPRRFFSSILPFVIYLGEMIRKGICVQLFIFLYYRHLIIAPVLLHKKVKESEQGRSFHLSPCP